MKLTERCYNAKIKNKQRNTLNPIKILWKNEKPQNWTFAWNWLLSLFSILFALHIPRCSPLFRLFWKVTTINMEIVKQIEKSHWFWIAFSLNCFEILLLFESKIDFVQTSTKNGKEKERCRGERDEKKTKWRSENKCPPVMLINIMTSKWQKSIYRTGTGNRKMKVNVLFRMFCQ